MTPPTAPRVENLGALSDPAEICAAFLDLPYLVLLDSVGGTRHTLLGQYSYLTADPAWIVRSKGTHTEVQRSGTDIWTQVEGDALDVARKLLQEFETAPVEGLPPFQGGAAGYIGYDYGSTLEQLPQARYDDLSIPDVILGIYDWVIAWDHRLDTAWLISTGFPAIGKAKPTRAKARAETIQKRLELMRLAGRRVLPEDCVRVRRERAPAGQPRAPIQAPTHPVPDAPPALSSTFTHQGYLAAVAAVRDYILAGDIFQANLSQRFQAPLQEHPFQLYQRLRQRNPAPFAAYLEFEDLAVISASPERFLAFDPQRRIVETRPIKGTRPRGLDPRHDAALGQALTESDKDRAENVMIVDLLRNDLSRVCRPGTVRVPELFTLERHPTVYHLVSTVVGELAPGADAIDLLRAAFPGGSITGAPKIRAMEIIAELEPTRRGVYCGAIGYLSATGAMDTSIVIRTYLARHGQVYFQAGGGIVADSDPEQEYRETLDKAKALIEALPQ